MTYFQKRLQTFFVIGAMANTRLTILNVAIFQALIEREFQVLAAQLKIKSGFEQQAKALY